ncbi:MAG: helix-turn-helix transcriptional regulator [Pseudomonadota bacterium]
MSNTKGTYSTCNYRAWSHKGQFHILKPLKSSNGAMNYDPLKLFGLRVIELRQKLGWSQERLAIESGLARSYVGGIERGERNLSLINICRIAETLSVDPSELLIFR